ncbi:hypothetical protein G8770_19220 [Aestuariicella hydrocarbonica]|uniref:Uncharacterized protein n=1 Tax=Pseudomaricurvus hydrocarbonicus TaxID=1470433 RepID=A0A9E5T436_9GAMM|nr:hypothetical protein [Aestuariicella hydrocarbonica]NHO67683.1 hypothetical protein [Aestuariicella hydrocarbonica]
MDTRKLKPLYEFMIANREFNRSLQNRNYKSIINPHVKTEDKVISLLYQIANTQSQPKIDKLVNFYKSLYEDISCLNSFSEFIQKLSGQSGNSFSELFIALKKQDGWGDKTSALFVKSIFHLHNGEYDSSLKFWNDVPTKLEGGDSFKLPVDAVIMHIFREIGLDNPTFSKINSLLSKHYESAEIEVWDDLWFWGFITQRGSGINRDLIWNENKYWAIENSSKCIIEIAQIKEKASEFINIIS